MSSISPVTSPTAAQSQPNRLTTSPIPSQNKALPPLSILYQSAQKGPPPSKSQSTSSNKRFDNDPSPELWHREHLTRPKELFLELFNKHALANATLPDLFSEEKASQGLFLFYALFSNFLQESEQSKRAISYREIIQLFHLKTLLDKQHPDSIFMEEKISPLFQKFFSTALEELSLENKKQFVRFFSLIDTDEAQTFRSSFQSYFFQGKGVWESNQKVILKYLNWIDDKIKSNHLKEQLFEHFNISWEENQIDRAVEELSHFLESQFDSLNKGREAHLPKYFLSARKLRHYFSEEKPSIFHKRVNTEQFVSKSSSLKSMIDTSDQDSMIGLCHLIEWQPNLELKSSTFPFQLDPTTSTLFPPNFLENMDQAPYPIVSITKGTKPSTSTLRLFEKSTYLSNLSPDALQLYCYLQQDQSQLSSLMCRELKDADSTQVISSQKRQKINSLLKAATRV